MPNSSIRPPSIPDVIYEELRRDIAQGVYRPGPISIRQLADHFDVSTMPVREALRRLEGEGLVAFEGGRRIRVNALTEDDLKELLSIRISLETLALSAAMPQLQSDKELVAELKRLLKQMDEEQSDSNAWRTTNREWHELVYGAAEMPRLAAMIAQLWTAVEPYMRLYLTSPASLKVSQKQHRAILAAATKGDAAKAEAALREHLEVPFVELTKQLQAAAEDGSRKQGRAA
ncbi:MAG TPA: GntR family transcriptional regulator [Solirubrobacterales bacterium]|jgi:DNA-binding GntR family transcriptional regulator